jgi:DNA-binding LacI/PurR family transcriptional regulator
VAGDIGMVGQAAIREEIIRSIRSGRIREGDRIPSVRALSERCSVALLTAWKACVGLRDDGILDCLPRRGYFVGPNAYIKIRRLAPRRPYRLLIVTKSTGEDFLDDFYPRLHQLLLDGIGSLRLRSNIDVASVFSETELVERLESQPVDCVLGFGIARSRQTTQLIERRGVQQLWLDAGHDHDGVAVRWDQEQGAYHLGEYLLGLGHRDLAWFGGRNVPRLAGLAHAFAAFGVDFSRLRIYECRTSPTDVCRKIEELYQTRSLPTAMICYYDGMAAAAIKVMRRFGLLIPNQISVASFGDTRYCQYTEPELTSVSFSREKFVAAAVSLVGILLEGVDGATRSVLIDTHLAIRESCAPPYRLTH